MWARPGMVIMRSLNSFFRPTGLKIQRGPLPVGSTPTSAPVTKREQSHHEVVPFLIV